MSKIREQLYEFQLSCTYNSYKIIVTVIAEDLNKARIEAQKTLNLKELYASPIRVTSVLANNQEGKP